MASEYVVDPISNLNSTILNDVLHGDAGADTLSGGFGNDELHGEADNDRLFGEYGNDEGQFNVPLEGHPNVQYTFADMNEYGQRSPEEIKRLLFFLKNTCTNSGRIFECLYRI